MRRAGELVLSDFSIFAYVFMLNNLCHVKFKFEGIRQRNFSFFKCLRSILRGLVKAVVGQMNFQRGGRLSPF